MSADRHHVPALNRFRRFIAVAALVGLVLGLSGPADGYWTATSTGSHARSDAAILPVPDLTATSMTATGAALSWTQPFDFTGYTLAQTPGTLDGCAAHPATNVTECTVSGLSPNTSYKWSLTAQLHQWSSPTTVTATTPKQATTTTISNFTPQSGASGSAFSATVKVVVQSGFGTPAGTVTFRLYPTAGCTGAASFTSPAQALNAGSATASLQPTTGTYHWQATYNPTDSYNNSSTSSCSGPIDVTQAGGTYFATGPVKTITKTTANVDVQYPQGTVKGDLVLLVALNSETHQSKVNASGWDEIDHVQGDPHIGLQAWWHTAGTETSARIHNFETVQNSTSGRGASAWVITYKNMPNPQKRNVESGTATNALGKIDPSHVTIKEPHTTVISLAGTNRSSQLSLSAARDFSLRNSLTVVNPPHALGVADTFMGKTGTAVPPTWWNGVMQSTQWAYITVAFTSSP